MANNTTASGALDTDKFLHANLAYHNSMIYPDTSKSIAQSLLGRHLRDSLPAMREFYQIRKEFVMERRERKIVSAKSIKKMMESYDNGSRVLPPLTVGDSVRVQNQTTTRTTKWDKTGRVTKDLGNRQYEVLLDGSRRITMRNRKHLRRIPGKHVVIEEGEEEDESTEELEVSAPASPASSADAVKAESDITAGPKSPAVSADPEQVRPEPVQPRLARPEPVQSSPVASEPRKRGRSSVPPSRLKVTGDGKSYAAVVRIGPPGGKGCGPSVPRRMGSVRSRVEVQSRL